MDAYKINDITELLSNNTYPGRGIIIGKSPNGKYACSAYFIMGRSANSRNRIFVEKEDILYTEPFDASKVEDASLIIYAARKKYKNRLIITNGDHTDTIYEGLKSGKTPAQALKGRCFEPDAPNFTPRISGVIEFADKDFTYEMSILKSADEKGSACIRNTFSYPAINGTGHFIHTYACDGNPLPPFEGEPRHIAVYDDIDEFTDAVWNALNKDNRISLYVRYTELGTERQESRNINSRKAP